MTRSIRTLSLRVSNAYLLEGERGFVLIDTGFRSDRSRVKRSLRDAGCNPGELQLIVITHGDSDHSGNAAHLREAYGAKIGIHPLEVPAVERGNMFLARGSLSPTRRLLKPLMALFRLRRADRFSPDVLLKDGDLLAEYGLDARILHVPGHTAGSIAVLTADGDFFSGDFLENRTHPSIATFVDDPEVLQTSVARVRELGIQTVYPGHGAPFTMAEMEQAGCMGTRRDR